jgi:hypothetical protein
VGGDDRHAGITRGAHKPVNRDRVDPDLVGLPDLIPVTRYDEQLTSEKHATMEALGEDNASCFDVAPSA